LFNRLRFRVVFSPLPPFRDPGRDDHCAPSPEALVS
jgi:hypothetical protein